MCCKNTRLFYQYLLNTNIQLIASFINGYPSGLSNIYILTAHCSTRKKQVNKPKVSVMMDDNLARQGEYKFDYIN